MKKLIAVALLSLAIPSGHAEGLYFAGGYDFIPHASDWSIGYFRDNLALELRVQVMGKEEPNTRPGPENSVNLLAYLPWKPVFLRAGLVRGASGKNGYSYGAGFDYPLTGSWSLRSQVTFYNVTEDYEPESEAEHQLSVGLKYQF